MRISRFGAGAVAVIVCIVVAVVLLPKPNLSKSRLVNGARFAKGFAQYARDVSRRGEALPPSVTLDTLIQAGYLTSEDARPFEGAKVTFYTDADATRPQSILVVACMKNGEVQAVLGDGSVQEFSASRWAQIRKSLGRPNGAANQAPPSGAETNRTPGAAGPGR